MTSPARMPDRFSHALSTDKTTDVGAAGGIQPHRVLHLVRRRLWLVAATTLLCGAGGVGHEITRPPVYEASAALTISPPEMHEAQSTMSRAEDTDNDAPVGDQMRVLASNGLLGALIDTEDLVRDPEFYKPASPLAEIRRILDMTLGLRHATADVSGRRPEVLAKLAEAVAVRRRDGNSVVDVSVRTADAAKSARLANQLVALYLAQAATAVSDLNRKVDDALQNRLAELGACLREADERIERDGIADHLGGGVLAGDLRLRTETVQPAIATGREHDDRGTVDPRGRQHGAAVGSPPEVVPSPALDKQKLQLADALRRQTALARELGPLHPDMMAASQQVRTARRLLDIERQRFWQAARDRPAPTREPEASRHDAVDEPPAVTPASSGAEPRQRALEQEAAAARARCTALPAGSRDLGERREVFTSDIRQIGTAIAAPDSATPPRPSWLVASLLLGLVLGTLLAGLIDTLEPGRRALRE